MLQSSYRNIKKKGEIYKSRIKVTYINLINSIRFLYIYNWVIRRKESAYIKGFIDIGENAILILDVLIM